jgi:antitoxin (DNA-binding transcriptional repressor) of toxin-antitoxin stability system
MKEMSISEFSTKCLEVLDRVRVSGEGVRLTTLGKPVVEIVATNPPVDRVTWLESMKGSVEIKGDIVSPATDEDE